MDTTWVPVWRKTWPDNDARPIARCVAIRQHPTSASNNALLIAMVRMYGEEIIYTSCRERCDITTSACVITNEEPNCQCLNGYNNPVLNNGVIYCKGELNPNDVVIIAIQ